MHLVKFLSILNIRDNLKRIRSCTFFKRSIEERNNVHKIVDLMKKKTLVVKKASLN